MSQPCSFSILHVGLRKLLAYVARDPCSPARVAIAFVPASLLCLCVLKMPVGDTCQWQHHSAFRSRARGSCSTHKCVYRACQPPADPKAVAAHNAAPCSGMSGASATSLRLTQHTENGHSRAAMIPRRCGCSFAAARHAFGLRDLCGTLRGHGIFTARNTRGSKPNQFFKHDESASPAHCARVESPARAPGPWCRSGVAGFG